MICQYDHLKVLFKTTIIIYSHLYCYFTSFNLIVNRLYQISYGSDIEHLKVLFKTTIIIYSHLYCYFTRHST